ncbi:CotH kinase family protein [Solibaculum mannosilyticum]|uniref:Spore coat protein CotH n=1 Tax=Solibaculum mannosilyticum TaxID=2780922 RepID=A0A7I8D672_9FIRM|nr:CotH kinase family protein [Solibaculum mannosilyticum]BCI60703.1 hypothetical protein C12CBH8_13420 [Solibaculum mannosilyticum]
MSTHKHINTICCISLVAALLITILFLGFGSTGIVAVSKALGYEERLFDTSRVHTLDIVMDNWDEFVDNCQNEEYVSCSVVIDNESFKNVAIRAKGNTSLSSVAAYGNDRYSFKIEFDHYEDGKSYHGLDKLSLNNIIQDNTYMKDYLCYQMMGAFGVDSPLCSYIYITVNGEDWGLYLAVEGVEESFLQRNYGSDYGELYKPDSTSMGGGRGNGGNFDFDRFQEEQEGPDGTTDDDGTTGNGSGDNTQPTPPDGNWGDNFSGNMPDPGEFPGGSSDDGMPDMGDFPGFSEDGSSGETQGNIPEIKDFTGGSSPESDSEDGPGNMEGPGGMGDSDVSLIYTDDDYDSYRNIFDNAKTDITDNDKDRLIASLKQLGDHQNISDIVDIDEVLRYFVVHNFVCNFDSYTGSMIHNYYLYEEDGQLSMIPWDYNLAFGGFMSMGDTTSLVNYPIDTPVSGGTVDSRPMLAWIFQNDEYTQMYHDYFAQFIADTFDNGCFASMMDKVVELISPYVQKDPTKFCTYEEFETGISTLEQFCTLRAQSISGQLDGSIPSTSSGQSSDSSSLIDASQLSIDTMGSMGIGGGSGNGRGQMNHSDEDTNPSNSGDIGDIPQCHQGDFISLLNGTPLSSSSDALFASTSSAFSVSPAAFPAAPDSTQGNRPPSGDFDGGMGGMGGGPAGSPPGSTDDSQPSGTTSQSDSSSPPSTNDSNDNGQSLPSEDSSPGSGSNSDSDSTQGMQPPSDNSGGGMPGQDENTQNGMQNPFDSQTASSQWGGMDTQGWILLGISIFVLGIGLLVACLMKGKNW